MPETFTKQSQKCSQRRSFSNLSCFLTSASVHTDRHRHTGVSSPRAPEGRRSGGACCQCHRAAWERSNGAACSTAWAPALRPWSPHRAAAVTPAEHHGHRESTSRTHRQTHRPKPSARKHQPISPPDLSEHLETGKLLRLLLCCVPGRVSPQTQGMPSCPQQSLHISARWEQKLY